MFKKRTGTSGIRGHLYETKLISLILFRAKHDDAVEEIYLASNTDEIGAFDDICFKVKLKGHNRPLVVFVQAKHRERDKNLHLNNNENLIKYFNSYIEIRKKFNSDQVKNSTEERIFNEKFNETECKFVIYTNEKNDENNHIDKTSFDILDHLIATGKPGYHLYYAKDLEESLCKLFINSEMMQLATCLSRCLNNKTNTYLLTDITILRYHVILAENVLNVSEITPEGHRIGTFRHDFLSTTNEFLVILRDKLYEAIYRTQKLKQTVMQEHLLHFFSDPCESSLNNIIGSAIVYENGKLEFSSNVAENIRDYERLEQITLPVSIVNKAIAKVAKDIMLSAKFKVPVGFGNRDLVIRGNEDKVKKRLDHLTVGIINLIKKYRIDNIVTIAENIGDGLFRHNGGLGSAIGNILVYDNDSKLIKFTDNIQLLQNNSKRLLTKLLAKIDDLQDLRFDIKVGNLPKLTIEGDVEYFVRDFLNTLILYTEQSNERDLEDILRKEIENKISTDNFKIKSDAIFLKYHNEIQKWWQIPKEAFYLTRANDFYEQAAARYINEPLISMINMIFMNYLKTVEYTYNDNTVDYLQLLDKFPVTLITTDETRLTAIKIIQYLKDSEYLVLNLHYIFKMVTNEFISLLSVLNELRPNYKIIIICDKSINIQTIKPILIKIIGTLNEKNVFIIVHKTLEGSIKNYFKRIDHVLDDTKRRFLDLSKDSQNYILKNTPVIFQDQEMYLESIVDNVSVQFIQGPVLNDIMLNKRITIGEYFGSYIYEEVRKLYVDRRVYCNGLNKQDYGKCKVLKTFYDLNLDVVLITAKPGMGKSMLLTHLSHNTKKVNKKVWIIRINLLEYAIQFSKWKKDKIAIDILNSLQFICQTIFKSKVRDWQNLSINLSVINNEVYLNDYTHDDWIEFELKLFLHFFNKGNLIFLFDGFDEICPLYMDEVLLFLKIINSQPQRNNIWITSRPNVEIISILEESFGKSYELDNIDYEEQGIYLDALWDNKFDINDLNEHQYNNLEDFLEFMASTSNEMSRNEYVDLNKSLYFPILRVYSHFEYYIRVNIKYLPKRQNDQFKTYGVTEFLTFLFRVLQERDAFENILEFTGNPLHLNLLAVYLLNNLKYNNNWNMNINTYTLYEQFIEAKLKDIRFKDKNKMDIHKPDIKVLYEKELADFMAKHKMLAAYSLFQMNGFDIFNKKELKEIKKLIKLIKNGDYKSEFICEVINNIPQFVHLTFAKHFATEYACDLSETEDRVEHHSRFQYYLSLKWTRII